MPAPSLDDLRRAFPHLGFAVYAMDPADPVTLEVHADGEVYAFTANTWAEALRLAFPPPPEEPEPSAPPPAVSILD